MNKQTITIITLIATVVILLITAFGAVGFKENLDEWIDSTANGTVTIGQTIIRALVTSLYSVITAVIAAYIAFLAIVAILKVIQISIGKHWLNSIIGMCDIVTLVPSAAVFIISTSIFTLIVFLSAIAIQLFNFVYYYAED